MKTVTVEGEMSYLLSDRCIYRPSQRQKQAAANAIDLFSMLTKDVKRVEFIAFPTDPRFKGANYVLNFVMQKYEWGGYTRIEADQWFSVNRTEGNVYSKFAYKDMTFDIYADEIYFSNRHGGVDMTEQFRFPDLFGKGPQNIHRHTHTDKYMYKTNSNDITFRAVYNTMTTQFANRLNLAINDTPNKDEEETVPPTHTDLNGILVYNGKVAAGTEFVTIPTDNLPLGMLLYSISSPVGNPLTGKICVE